MDSCIDFDGPPEYSNVDEDLGLELDSDLDSLFLTARQQNLSSKGRSQTQDTKWSSIEQNVRTVIPTPPSTAGDKSVSDRQGFTRASSIVAQAASRPSTNDWQGFDQVAELQRQNAALHKRLDQQSRLTDVNGVSSQIGNISKRLREVTASYHSERAKNLNSKKDIDALNARIQELESSNAKLSRNEYKLRLQLSEKEAQDNEFSRNSTTADVVQNSKTDGKAEISDSQHDRLRLRQECQSLRKELKLVQIALAKEVGDNIPVNKVLSSTSNWKGRAEQIRILKSKLEQKNSCKKSSMVSRQDRLSKSSAMSSKITNEVEKLSTELKTLSEQHSRLQKSNDAAKARCRSLSRENKSLKESSTSMKIQADKLQKEISELKSRCVELARDRGILPPPGGIKKDINSKSSIVKLPEIHRGEKPRISPVNEDTPRLEEARALQKAAELKASHFEDLAHQFRDRIFELERKLSDWLASDAMNENQRTPAALQQFAKEKKFVTEEIINMKKVKDKEILDLENLLRETRCVFLKGLNLVVEH